VPYPVGIAKTAATAAPIVGIPTPPIPPIPPGGGGGSPETFTVTLSAGQVSDSLGVTAPATTLATFQATAPVVGIYYGAGGSSGPVFATNTPATLKGKAVFDPASPVIRGAHPKPIPKTNGKHHHHKSSSGGSHSKGKGGKHHRGAGHKKH
jgi:hypothetical protein